MISSLIGYMQGSRIIPRLQYQACQQVQPTSHSLVLEVVKQVQQCQNQGITMWFIPIAKVVLESMTSEPVRKCNTMLVLPNIYGHNPKNLKFRFQRVAPIHVSSHNPDVVYHTSQYVHKTVDNGQTWEIISPDLTAFESTKQMTSGSPITRDVTGEEYYSTLYAIQESKIREGLIWVGANDGPIHVTQNGGESWEDVTPEMPKGGRVDGVEPSPHREAKAYAAILRYQVGDFKPYIYKTEDYGKSWKLDHQWHTG